MPKISIITTTYKHEKFIKETIESILSQTFTDWELLIWDDSPNYETWNIIQEFTNKYPDKIKAWHHNPNKGIVDNMNFLIWNSSNDSEYIAFLEWDDLFTNENLEKKLKIFQKYPEVKLIYNNLDFINEDSIIIKKNILSRAPYIVKNNLIWKEDFILKENFYISYSTLIIDKIILNNEKIKRLWENKNYSVSDWDLFFRISSKYKIYWLEESLTLYRKHSNNLSWTLNNILDDLETQIEDYEKNNIIWKEITNKKKSYLNLVKAVWYLDNDKIKSFYFLKKWFYQSNFNKPIYSILIFLMLFLPKKINNKIIKFYRWS